MEKSKAIPQGLYDGGRSYLRKKDGGLPCATL